MISCRRTGDFHFIGQALSAPRNNQLNLYLSEEQYHKLCLVAESENKSPEEVANNAVYGYLAIVNPFEEDREPPEGVHEILFDIPEEAAE